jgi:2-hydroxychromene-2-carboxylate isomerase
MWALKQGKGNDVFAAFLQAAFTLGINTNSLPGMRRVVELAGLDWQEAKYQMQDESWQDMLEENRQTMYGFGNWGVPSYRLLDAQGNPIVSAWGQDRLWLIAHKIMENS